MLSSADWRRRRRVASTALVLATALTLSACSGGSATTTAGSSDASASATLASSCAAPKDATTPTQTDKVLTIGREGNTSFTRNFNPFSPTALWPTPFAMYDSLFVYNRGSGTAVPRLATEWSVAPGGDAVTFTLRQGVKWSDGEPFTAEDVAYTFDLQRKVYGDDVFSYVTSVDPTDSSVTFSFSRPYSPGLYELGAMLIIPKHIWETVPDPTKYTNENPVATGPFTEVSDFSAQAYQVDRNPNYWDTGKPYIKGVRVPAFPTNDQVQLALANGEIDWADIFVPEIEKTFIRADPTNRCYWFPSIAGTVHLYLNTQKKPFDNPNVRKAISMAVDRDQILTVAMNGYGSLPDTSGIGPRYASWKQAAPTGENWATLNLDEADKLLDAAGLKKGADGIRTMPDGSPIDWTIKVGSASTDWTASSQVIAQNLKKVGLDVKVEAQDWGAVIDQASKGDFTMAHMWSSEGVTPYNFYRGVMSSQSFIPLGEATNENYQRYEDPAADALLEQFAATSDVKAQQGIVAKLGDLYAKDAPAIPLFSGVEFGEYNITRFSGFPSQDDPFADPNTRSPTAAIVLSDLRSR